MNPLALEGTALPPPQLLAAKLLVVYLVVRTLLGEGTVWKEFHVFLPFVSSLEALRGIEWLSPGLAILFTGASIAVLVNLNVRGACVTLGVLQVLSILSDSRVYSNSSFLFGCLFFLIGLQDGSRSRLLIRAQIVLVYAGAGLNKLFDADWRSGQFVEYWTREILNYQAFNVVAGWFTEGALALGLGWFVIVAELGLAVAFARPSWTRQAVLAGLAFHSGMLVFTGGRLSVVFFFLMSVSYLALATWPSGPLAVRMGASPWSRGLCRALRAGDADRKYVFTTSEGALGVASGDGHISGARAAARLVLTSPLAYLVGTGALLALRYGPAYVQAAIRMLLG